MSDPLSPSARRVQETLRALGFPHEVVELSESARSASEAAQAIGCEVDRIAKSLVFRAQPSDRAFLVVAAGGSRIDEARLAREVGDAIGRADPRFVRERTGFAIGGVPPIGHREPIEVFVDRRLLAHESIWAAAGTPRAVFRLTPEDLLAMTGGRVVDVT